MALTPAALEDAAIRQTILTAMDQEPWAPRAMLDVSVCNGVVQLGGCLYDVRVQDALQVLAENIPGVKQVENNLVCIDPPSGIATLDPAWEDRPSTRKTELVSS